MATFTENLSPGINKYGYKTPNQWISDTELHVGLSDATNLYATFSVIQFTIPEYRYKYITSARLHIYCIDSGNCESVVDLLNYSGSLSENSGAIYTYRDLLATASERLPKNSSGWVTINVIGMVESMRGQTMTLRIKSQGTVRSEPQVYSSSRGSYAPYITVEGYDDVPVATAEEPYGVILQKTSLQTFKWNYFSTYGEAQYAYDFEYREQGTVSWTVVHAESENTSYSMSTLGLSTGVIEWRVRVYNPNSVVSEYAYATFELIGVLAPISITSVSNESIPTIAWSGDTEETSKIQIRILQDGVILWDSGDMPGNTSRNYKLNYALEDGTYICQMRSGNAYALWSDWAGLTFTISPLQVTTPDIAVAPVNDYLLITTTTAGTKILYRSEDGESYQPIMKFTDLQYADTKVKPNIVYTYYIKYINGGSKNSDKAAAVANYKGYRISKASDPTDTITLKHSLDEPFPVVSQEVQSNSAYGYYIGRKNKVKESGIQRSHTMSGTFYLSENDFNRLKAMIEDDEVFLLKSSKDIMYCDVVISDAANAMMNQGYNVEISCERVYYDDQVNYNED